jgi:hypothetical protein
LLQVFLEAVDQLNQSIRQVFHAASSLSIVRKMRGMQSFVPKRHGSPSRFSLRVLLLGARAHPLLWCDTQSLGLFSDIWGDLRYRGERGENQKSLPNCNFQGHNDKKDGWTTFQRQQRVNKR